MGDGRWEMGDVVSSLRTRSSRHALFGFSFASGAESDVVVALPSIRGGACRSWEAAPVWMHCALHDLEREVAR